MESFLKTVALDLLDRFDNRFEDVVIIMPGKRPKVFMNHILAQLVNKPILAPQMFTINEFIQAESSMDAIDSIPAIAELHKLYNLKFKHGESIEKFWYFGEMLLGDFNDLDKYMADAKKVFTYIKDLKEIEQLFDDVEDEQLKLIKQFWDAIYNGDIGDKKRVRQQFLYFWKILYPLYVEYKETLLEKNMGYEGMLYRMVAEKAMDGNITFDEKTPVFIGFNALSKSEIEIFSAAKKAGALFYWDYDSWYTRDPKQEAGFFMRKNLALFPSALGAEMGFDNIVKLQSSNIKLIAMPGELEMAMASVMELASLNDPGESPLRTALVLANETLLTPILDTMPPDIGALNITMGLPITNTSIFAFVQQLVNIDKQKTVSKNEIYYKSNWVLDLLMQPIQLQENTSVVKQIKKENAHFVKAVDFVNDPWLSKLFPNVSIDLVGYIKGILKSVVLFFAEQAQIDANLHQNSITVEAAIALYKALIQLEKQLNKHNLILSDILVIRLLNKIMSGLMLTLEGEPLHGKQIMGLIETRSLDFENVILVGANEGFIPKSGIAPSFIPYNLRKAYGLLTYEHQDAIFAYYFYRLIQRSKNITIVYNSNETDADYGERTRFLQQLLFERNLKIEPIAKSYLLKPVLPQRITIEKNHDVLQLLRPDKIDANALLYPSGLNTYLTCTLKFYFKYVAKLKLPDKLETHIDQRIFGNIFHDTMESLYKDFNNQLITADLLKTIDGDAHILREIKTQMLKQFRDLNVHKANNGLLAIVEQVVLRYVKKVLKSDAESVDFVLKSVEEKYTKEVILKTGEKIILAGKIDRMQQSERKIFVIDYKTGRPPHAAVKFDAMFDFGNPDRPSAPFQAMLYSYIVSKESFAANQEIVPALLYIQEKKPISEIQFGDRKNENFASLSDEFETQLIYVLEHLMDKTNCFEQTPHEENCLYCDYNVICGRT